MALAHRTERGMPLGSPLRGVSQRAHGVLLGLPFAHFTLHFHLHSNLIHCVQTGETQRHKSTETQRNGSENLLLMAFRCVSFVSLCFSCSFNSFTPSMTGDFFTLLLLPKMRNKTITHPLAILRVPPEISAQDLFLVEEAPDEDGKKRNGE